MIQPMFQGGVIGRGKNLRTEGIDGLYRERKEQFSRCFDWIIAAVTKTRTDCTNLATILRFSARSGDNRSIVHKEPRERFEIISFLLSYTLETTR